MSKIGRIFLTLLCGVAFGLLTWKLFPGSMIKLNPIGFVLMLVQVAILYFAIWKVSGHVKYALLDKIVLWGLIGALVFVFPEFLIAMRISWFFNTVPDFGILLLGSGIGLIFSVVLIHKILGRFFTNGLWILDIIHLTAPFWMPAIDPLTISLGATLKVPELFKWHSTYVYYAVVVCCIMVGLFLHTKRGNPQAFLLWNRFCTLERISLKITLTILMGLFAFVCGALLMKYSTEIKDLIHAQSIGLTVVGGYDFRIRMAKYLLLTCGGCCLGAGVMMIWLWFVKEIATAHAQIILILLPLMVGSVLIQMFLFLKEKLATLLLLLGSAAQYIPSLKGGDRFLYILYALIVWLSYILLRGLLLPRKDIKSEDSSLDIQIDNS